MVFSSVEIALQALKEGRFVIVVDDQNRENEGDLILAAETATPEALAFMIRHTTGIVCVSLKGERLDELKLPQMVVENTDHHRTAFTVSVDYRHGTSTGVSALDREKTIKALIDPKTKPDDLSRPGHIFPLRYKEGGVLKRAGHTEAAVDLAESAGLYPAGVICELMHEDGTMMRLPDLLAFAGKYHLPLISIADIIRYRRKRERLIECVSKARLPTDYGDFEAYVYESKSMAFNTLLLLKEMLHIKRMSWSVCILNALLVTFLAHIAVIAATNSS